jgi:hypothetical protein
MKNVRIVRPPGSDKNPESLDCKEATTTSPIFGSSSLRNKYYALMSLNNISTCRVTGREERKYT